MEKQPSEKCGDFVWWYEEPSLCDGCPNYLDAKTKKDSDGNNHS